MPKWQLPNMMHGKIMLSPCCRDKVMIVACFVVGGGMWAALPSDRDRQTAATKHQQ